MIERILQNKIGLVHLGKVLGAAIIFFVCTQAISQTIDVSEYTFHNDPTLNLGYPKGWSVGEELDETGTVASVSVINTENPDSEGYIFFLLRFPHGSPLQNSGQFSNFAITNLKTEGGLSGLVVNKEYEHPTVAGIHVSELTLVDGNLKFEGTSWGIYLETDEMVLAIFSLFYAPESTMGNYNPDLMLSSMIGPLFGEKVGSGAQQQPASASSQDIVEITETPNGEGLLFQLTCQPKKS